MKEQNFLRGNIILSKDSFITSIFKIKRGSISKMDHHQEVQIFQKDDILFLEELFSYPYSKHTYTANCVVVGQWISKKEILENAEYYFSILSKMSQRKSTHNELMILQDPILKVSRYFYFEYQNNQVLSFYTSMSMSELSKFLLLERKCLLDALGFLKSQNILAQQNKLFNILSLEKLEYYAYRTDYQIKK